MRENYMQQVLLHFSRSTGSIKNFSMSTKKFPWDKFVKKTEHFAKHFPVCIFFLELQCLGDDLVDFLKLSIFINVSLP